MRGEKFERASCRRRAQSCSTRALNLLLYRGRNRPPSKKTIKVPSLKRNSSGGGAEKTTPQSESRNCHWKGSSITLKREKRRKRVKRTLKRIGTQAQKATAGVGGNDEVHGPACLKAKGKNDFRCSKRPSKKYLQSGP